MIFEDTPLRRRIALFPDPRAAAGLFGSPARQLDSQTAALAAEWEQQNTCACGHVPDAPWYAYDRRRAYGDQCSACEEELDGGPARTRRRRRLWEQGTLLGPPDDFLVHRWDPRQSRFHCYAHFLDGRLIFGGTSERPGKLPFRDVSPSECARVLAYTGSPSPEVAGRLVLRSDSVLSLAVGGAFVADVEPAVAEHYSGLVAKLNARRLDAWVPCRLRYKKNGRPSVTVEISPQLLPNVEAWLGDGPIDQGER